jgi:hypothetical protein
MDARDAYETAVRIYPRGQDSVSGWRENHRDERALELQRAPVGAPLAAYRARAAHPSAVPGSAPSMPAGS